MIRTGRKTGLGAVVGACLLAVILTFPNESRASIAPALLAPLAESCSMTCWICLPDEHAMQLGGVARDAEGYFHTECFPGGCGYHWYSCSGGGESAGSGPDADPGEVWTAFVDAEPDELPDLLERHPDVIRYNSDRRAIQVVGCDQQVVVHVPVTEAQLQALTD
jgi:hypothetical protein